MSLKRGLKYLVLIVEDVDEMRYMLEDLVGKMPSFRVIGLAKNVWEARALVLKNKPHLVLLDEVLPGESGTDFARELKTDGISVLFITSMEDVVPPRIKKPDWSSLSQDQKRFENAMKQALGLTNP